jgi:hypothetical protein
VQQPEKAAPKTEAQRRRSLGFVRHRGVVESQALQRVTNAPVVGAVGRVNAAEHHGADLTVTRKGNGGRTAGVGHGVAHPGVGHVLDASGQISHVARAQEAGGQIGGENTPTSVTSKSAPVDIMRMRSPVRTEPSTTRT